MTKFAYVSDLHLDFNHKRDKDLSIFRSYTEKAKAQIGDTKYLIIAGDISNYNIASTYGIKTLLEYFEKIFYVTGNHDYYYIPMIEDNSLNNNRHKSFQRKTETLFDNRLIELSRHSGVFDVDGVKIAGANMWYDLDRPEALHRFLYQMNDSRFVTEEFVRRQYKGDKTFYNRVIKDVDIFVSHIPLHPFSQSEFKNGYCYLNNQKLHPNKVYISGHTHMIAEHDDLNSKFLSNAWVDSEYKVVGKLKTITL